MLSHGSDEPYSFGMVSGAAKLPRSLRYNSVCSILKSCLTRYILSKNYSKKLFQTSSKPAHCRVSSCASRSRSAALRRLRLPRIK